MIGRLLKFLRMPWASRVTLFEVAVLLVLVRLGLLLLSYERLLAILARFSVPRLDDRRRNPEYGPSVTWAASGLGGLIFRDRPCLTQALVVRLLLNRAGRQPELKIGVTKDRAGDLRGHAWLELDGRVIIGGGRSPDRYAELVPMAFSTRSEPVLDGARGDS